MPKMTGTITPPPPPPTATTNLLFPAQPQIGLERTAIKGEGGGSWVVAWWVESCLQGRLRILVRSRCKVGPGLWEGELKVATR